jgi:hypothetical protein
VDAVDVGDVDVGAMDVDAVDVGAVDVGPGWGCLAGRSFLDGRNKTKKKSTTTQLETKQKKKSTTTQLE